MINPFVSSIIVRCCLTVLTLTFLLTVNPLFAADKNYLINKGDRLKIDVWKEENLKDQVIVSPDGNITFPMIGTIHAAGKTLDELRKIIQKQLEEFIPWPEVLVSLITVEGNVIYVIGEVARPGPFTMSKNLKVMQALSSAGGLTPYASRNSIIILRETAEGKSISIPFEYGDLEDGENLDSNILLQSGDTIIVP